MEEMGVLGHWVSKSKGSDSQQLVNSSVKILQAHSYLAAHAAFFLAWCRAGILGLPENLGRARTLRLLPLSSALLGALRLTCLVLRGRGRTEARGWCVGIYAARARREQRGPQAGTWGICPACWQRCLALLPHCASSNELRAWGREAGSGWIPDGLSDVPTVDSEAPLVSAAPSTLIQLHGKSRLWNASETQAALPPASALSLHQKQRTSPLTLLSFIRPPSTK